MIHLLTITCSDYGIASILYIIKRALTVIQIMGPILTIIGLTINFTKMTMNPEEKKYIKNITNCIIATIVLFLLPLLVNVVMVILADINIETMDIPNCWVEAEKIHQSIDTN